MRAWPLVTALLVARPVVAPGQGPCLHYAPAVVTLQGRVERRGARPGSARDTVLVLVVSEPLCVAPDSASDDGDRAVAVGVREVQLALGTDSVWTQLRAVRSSSVRVTGELFHAVAEGRRPPVLLWAIEIGARSDREPAVTGR
jgi:hypothetical protein